MEKYSPGAFVVERATLLLQAPSPPCGGKCESRCLYVGHCSGRKVKDVSGCVGVGGSEKLPVPQNKQVLGGLIQPLIRIGS